MEQFFVHFAKDAAWALAIVFIFAIVGVVATVRWIVATLDRGARAVEAEAQKVEDAVMHRDG